MGVATATLLTVVSLGMPSQGTPAQPPPQTGLILGRVVDASSGRPVPGAIVTLDGAGLGPVTAAGGAAQPRAITNGTGQFVFRRLPKGTYGLTASKPGYLDGRYGRRRPRGSVATLELADGERTGDVVIPVWRFAAISGTVTDEAGEPVIGVEMRAFERSYLAGRRRLAPTGPATTDDRGVYRFGSLAPGEYVIGFVSREITLPASTAEILRQPSNDPKYQELSRERFGMGATALFGPAGSLQVGDIVRQVSGPIPPPTGPGAAVYIYPTQYFPGAAALRQAATLTLKSGEERGSIDFSLRPVRTSRVSGIVMGPDGPIENVALRLAHEADEFGTEMEPSATMSGPGGAFTFLGVPAGQYAVKVLRIPRAANPLSEQSMTMVQAGGTTIFSSAGTPGATPPRVPADPTLWASVPVPVADTDVSGVTVVLQTGARVKGRLEFDGSAERPDAQRLERISIAIERSDRAVGGAPFISIPPGRVDGSGTFTTYGIPGGKYMVRVGGAPAGWTLRSVTVEGRDVSDTPLEIGAPDVTNVVITFTDRPTKLTGVVHGAAGNADPDALVVVFPTDTAQWQEFGLNPRRMRSVRVAKAGSYTFTGLPAGEYFVAAIKDELLPAWQYPEMLETLSRLASQISLSEGETRTQALKTVTVR